MAHDILIVDDEKDIRLLVEGILQDEGYNTRGAANSDDAREMIHSRRPHLLILDIWLMNSRLDGLELLQALRHEDTDLPVVMISGHGNIETAVKSIKLGAYDFIEKPFKADRMLHVVARAIEAARLRRENAELREKTLSENQLVGNSSQIQDINDTIRRVAPTASRVLISGAPGTGKEVVARHIHMLSKRESGPFVTLNCAISNPDRIEQELFGVEDTTSRGVDAHPSRHTARQRIGIFERAHGGTLLLDEVSDMPLQTQGKFIRALQDQAFKRIGGERTVEVDVRVVASTCRDLQERVVRGEFREDLFYRLNVVPLRMPLLKDRKEDISTLTEYFMTRSAQTLGLKPRKLTRDALMTLQRYEWPGNVRQLRNVIEWLLIMSPGEPEELITAEMLPNDISALFLSGALGEDVDDILKLPMREARELFEKQYLESQMLRFGGNISKTADFVGLERSSLHRKLRSLGISS